MVKTQFVRSCTTAFICSAALMATGIAQESFRPSYRGTQASLVRLRPERPIPNYDIRTGPIYFDLTGALELEYNDNVNLSDDEKIEDFIIRPLISLDAAWSVTHVNTLRLKLGVGYAKYLDHNEFDTNGVLLHPDSEIAFDVFVGDFRINFHDRFSLLQNPIDEIAVDNQGEYTRFQNAAGIEVLWDLNDVKMTFGYDHYNFWALDSEFEYIDHSEEQFSYSAAVALSDAWTAGVDVNAAIVNYDKGFNNDGSTVSTGPFVETQLSNYLRLRLSGGYQGMYFDSGGDNQDNSDLDGYYASLGLVHRVNAFFTQTLTGGHESRLGLQTNYAELNYVRYSGLYNLNRHIALAFDGFFEDLDESGGFLSENAQRYGASVGTNYQLTERVNVGLRYQHTRKDSDLVLRDYDQNRYILHVSYDF